MLANQVTIPETLYLEYIDNTFVLRYLSISLLWTCDRQTNTQIYGKSQTNSHFEVKTHMLIYFLLKKKFGFVQSVSTNAFLGKGFRVGTGGLMGKCMCLESPGNKGSCGGSWQPKGHTKVQLRPGRRAPGPGRECGFLLRANFPLRCDVAQITSTTPALPESSFLETRGRRGVLAQGWVSPSLLVTLFSRGSDIVEYSQFQPLLHPVSPHSRRLGFCHTWWKNAVY